MADPVAVDANVIVAMLYEQDAKHADAGALLDRIQAAGREIELIDVLVLEALSVLGRRAAERKTSPPDFAACVARVEQWRNAGLIRPMGAEMPDHMKATLELMAGAAGKLSANDAFILVLQRTGAIDEMATFDEQLASMDGFRRFA
jgi:predicted nucleic acid-binding protein